MKRAMLSVALWPIAAACAPAGAAPVAKAIPFKADSAGGPDLSAGAFGILGLSLLAIGVVWLVRKRLNLHQGAPGTGGAVRIIETQRLGPRALLTVVEFGGRRHLLAQTEHGINCLVSDSATEQEKA